MAGGRRFDFIDLKAQQREIYPRLKERIDRVLAHGQYILGPEVFELEERLAAYVGVEHAISCASGTDALLMALMAYGVGPGDAISPRPSPSSPPPRSSRFWAPPPCFWTSSPAPSMAF